MFCWGNSTHHELCTYGSEPDLILRPTFSKWQESNRMRLVAAGEFHALYLTNMGNLYSCGSNDVGQLGRDTSDNEGHKPGLVETFKGCTISAVSCGSHHSMALDEWGQPFSWGSDCMGQLGSNLGPHAQDKPKIVKFLATKNVIQIACGANHSIALTNNGDLFAWGANSYGQCGLGTMSTKETTPQKITSLIGVPIAMIVCGSSHTFALSKSGAVFGWGKNKNGQLGLQDKENRWFPTHLKTLRNAKVCHIACGEDFTAFLTLDGGVFTCGNGEYGQTGHGTTKDELVPKKIMELMGSTVTQVVCGRRHLLCRVGDKILACGYGARGQLGNPHMPFALVPTPVCFTSNDDSPYPPDIFNGPMTVFAGGDHSFLLVNSDKLLSDFRNPEHTKQMLSLTLPKVAACEMFKEDDIVNQDLMAYLETVFSSHACLNGSFLLSNNAHYGCSKNLPGIDLKKAEEVFTVISRIEKTSIQQLIFNHLTEKIIKKVKVSPPDAEALRVFVILPMYHEMRNPRRHPELQGPFAEAFNNLSAPPQRIVQLWWEAQTTEYFEMLVDIFKSVIVYELMQPAVRANRKLNFTHSLIQILNALTTLNKLNFTNPRKPIIPFECFYIEDMCNYIDIPTDYISWLSDQDSTQIHMCNYAFLFDVQCKSLLLKIDQQLQMQMAVTRAATQMFTRLFTDPSYEYQRDQFLNLTVSRNHIVRDTMQQISNHDTSQLKKPLKVEFVGEEAEDAGGVRKEFFMLLLKEIFDPVYGMFMQSEETNMIWFSNNPFEDDVMYYLIGAMYGLAIYNSIIIYVPFPMVLYKKLLSESVMLDDLSDLYPTLSNSLKSLLEYQDEDVEEVFGLCFAVNTVVFDQIQVHSLKENGENIPVTHENKDEYVDLYVDFLLNKSVENQFKSFNQGFQKVCGGRIIKLFRSHELMSVVMGNEEYDWDVFESNCEYKNGYTASDQQIRWFWESFHELPLEDKKKFLLFLTGSDRVPIQGMRDIKIRIQPVADDKYFPVAHTCFNLLDLPRYQTKERLKYYLTQAIQQTQGFSLV